VLTVVDCQRSFNFPHLWSSKIPHPQVGLS
jgi:hypothetical protein